MDKEAAHSLRAVVHDCLAKHMYEAAAVFADKLVTLTGYAAIEVYTLAQAFFCSRQFRRSTWLAILAVAECCLHTVLCARCSRYSEVAQVKL